MLTYGSADVIRIFLLPFSGRIFWEPIVGAQVGLCDFLNGVNREIDLISKMNLNS